MYRCFKTCQSLLTANKSIFTKNGMTQHSKFDGLHCITLSPSNFESELDPFCISDWMFLLCRPEAFYQDYYLHREPSCNRNLDVCRSQDCLDKPWIKIVWVFGCLYAYTQTPKPPKYNFCPKCGAFLSFFLQKYECPRLIIRQQSWPVTPGFLIPEIILGRRWI